MTISQKPNNEMSGEGNIDKDQIIRPILVCKADYALLLYAKKYFNWWSCKNSCLSIYIFQWWIINFSVEDHKIRTNSYFFVWYKHTIWIEIRKNGIIRQRNTMRDLDNWFFIFSYKCSNHRLWLHYLFDHNVIFYSSYWECKSGNDKVQSSKISMNMKRSSKYNRDDSMT